jgi:hypothetical protein
MALKYGFFNSVDGDRTYNAEDLGRYLHGIVSSGVYADRSDSLQVLANGDLTVTVQPGRAMLDCHYLENDAPLTFTLSGGGTLDRIDIVVMRLDLGERTCSIIVKEGTPATTPTRPTLLRQDNTKEYMLALIRVPKYTQAITQSNITDTRPDNSVCGWVTGVIDQVDTSTLFAQWQAAYEEQYALAAATQQEKEAAFNAWWDELVGQAVVNGLPVPTTNNAGQTVLVNGAGTGYELGPMPFPYQESADYQGCYCRIQGGETEWLNPPMVKDITYRTVERHNGKPVYARYCLSVLGVGENSFVTKGEDVDSLVAVSCVSAPVGASKSYSNFVEDLRLSQNPATKTTDLCLYNHFDVATAFYITVKFTKKS